MEITPSTETQNLSNLSEEYPYIIAKTEDDTWEYESKQIGTWKKII
jgi:hypothetical protein